MKFNKLLPSAIITISAIVMTAGISYAESSDGQGFSPRGGNAQSRKPQGRKLRKFKALNLTEAQKSQIQKIKQNYRDKIVSFLTSEQKKTLELAKKQGQNPRQAMRNLNLTSEQKQKLRELKKSQRQEVEAILTAEQKQQLQELRQHRRSRRGGRRGAS